MGPDLRNQLKLDFDPTSLREKYRTERDKRLRPERSAQYTKAEGDFERYRDDHSADTGARDPIAAEVDVTVVGGGFGGLNTAARLRQVGVKNLRIIDRAGDFGGVWYWNRYPGAGCDTEAYCYLPLLEETGYMPSHRYVDADEIHQHAQRIGRHFDLYKDALFQTGVTKMVWQEERARWRIETDRGDLLESRFVVVCGGETVSPKLPGIPGIRDFQGHSFHTSRWDYAYTGGGVQGDLHKLKGKRVALIGTGASAVQCVPALAEGAEHLYVFQRTPSSVDARNNAPTDPEWVKSLTPGWQERRMTHLIETVEGKVPTNPLQDFGWAGQAATYMSMAGEVMTTAAEANLELSMGDILEIANMKYMEKLRERCDAVVKDPATAEALKPYYSLYCKRPVWHDGYLETFNRPNVTLVDTDGMGVDRITETGVVANGREFPVDLIIYGSGLEAGQPEIFKFIRFPVVGRSGVTLDEWWADGYRTMFGLQVHNMPNYFQLSIIGNGVGVNYLHGNGVQAQHVADVVSRCFAENIKAIEPTAEAEDEWRKVLDDSLSGPDALPFFQTSFLAECTPGYFNAEGNPDDRRALWMNVHGGGGSAYIEALRAWQESGDMPGLQVTHGLSDLIQGRGQ
ncbi:NAD(P)/FAD-dependent oxidoreductase [Streptomyces ipomoeae]|nr:NAD(P)/FAD-dependent oxidoreductase [Streptomyces ipomoeae]